MRVVVVVVVTAVAAACGGAAPQRVEVDGVDEDAVPRGATAAAAASAAAPAAAAAPAPAPAAAAAADAETGSGTGTGTGTGTGAVTVSVTAEGICERIGVLREQGCGFLERYEVSRTICVADYERALRERPGTEEVGRCFLDEASCEAVVRCLDDRIGA